MLTLTLKFWRYKFLKRTEIISYKSIFINQEVSTSLHMTVLEAKEEMVKFFLSFDNMCHVDELKLLQKQLALPPPFDDVWLLINKVIDPLHIKNHVRHKCKELYNPEKVREAIPEANLMCAEQTFAWMGRY